MGVTIGAAALLLGLAIGLKTPGVGPLLIGGVPCTPPGSAARGAPTPRFATCADPVKQKTTKDKLYTKEQATRGAEIYVKHCERCHTPEKVPEGKKPGPPVIGEKFLDTWLDRPLGELFATILNTMPSDGSAVLTVDQSLDATAYILKANGFPEGTTAMKNDDAMRTAVIVK